MGKEVLGGFEHQVLLAVVHLGEEGTYTVPIVDFLREAAGKAPAPAAVYTTLRRLEARGLLTSRVQPSELGGRPRRVFRALPEALEELRRTRETLERLWKEIPVVGGS
jgi:DNA-binding PadR family transcriptional regulator